MEKTAIWFGIALMLLGVLVFIGTNYENTSSFIPAILGLALTMLGLAALNSRYQKKAMHTAVVLTVFGFFGSGLKSVSGLAENTKPADQIWLTAQIVVTIICAVFIGLSLKSLYDLKKERFLK